MKVAIYARVSSDRQDVDLSIGAQLRALREYAAKNGYQVVREYVDEAESGRTADRPQFQRMIAEAGRASRPFQKVLVWKFARFARSREDDGVFKSLLKKHGLRVESITEPSDDSPTGKLMEAIIESLDEFYSANLGQEVFRGCRRARPGASMWHHMPPTATAGSRLKDGKKEPATLQPDAATAPFVQRMFEDFLHAEGLKEVLQAFSADGIASPDGGTWNKTTIHKVLTNAAYAGTLVWGKTAGLERKVIPSG